MATGDSETRAVAEGGALRRMVRRAAPARRASGGAEALRRAAPRVLDRVAGVSVGLGEPLVTPMARSDLAAALPEGALVLRLAPVAAEPGAGTGAETGHGGLAWMAPDLFAALVERRLTGALRPAAPAGRGSTPLDAVICGELVDALCAEPGVLGEAAMRAAGHLCSPDLAVVLPDMPFQVTRLHLDLGRTGGRGGELGLALPDPPPEERPAAAGLPRAELMGCRAEMTASLPPVVLPWARVAALAPGDLLTLDEGAMDGVRLHSILGERLGRGRLGRLGEMRAVRLRDEAPTGAPGAPAEDPAHAPPEGLPDLMAGALPEPFPADPVSEGA